MKQLGLMHFTDTHLTSLGLIIFFVFFILVAWWVNRNTSKELYEYTKNLPFEPGENHE